jgi:CheY-like chemotaxis protein
MQSGKKKILVVDDEPDAVTFLATALEDQGWETVRATNGVEAMECVRRDRPDLVTLDVTMPEQSGVKTYRQIKEDPEFARIPVVIVTGIAAEFQQFISTRRQVPPPEGYLAKPIDVNELVETVRRLLSGNPSE